VTSTEAASKESTSKESARELLAINMLRLRRAQGLSQEELAFRAGLHRTFIAHVERVGRNIAIDNIERIAAALSVETWRLLCPRAERQDLADRTD
jgi:transcriptional regulator with XRE-family HTH domain